MKKFIVSIDQGTTSSRAILFNLKGKPLFVSQLEFTQYFPKDGWVEHNPEEIWKTTQKVLKDVILRSKKLKGKILTIGITNQRETTILWDKHTGKPVYNAIVWQDRRAVDYCNKLIKQKKALYNYDADQRDDKWSQNSQLERVDLNMLPKYINLNLEKYKAWID